jgi:hypothetical protein
MTRRPISRTLTEETHMDRITLLAQDDSCAITHLCGFLRTRGLRLADRSNYTQSLPRPSNNPREILTAVAACGDARLTIVDDSHASAGWVYLIMPPAVAPEESVADYGMNPLTEAWAKSFDDLMEDLESDYPDFPTPDSEDGPEWQTDSYARWVDRQ